MLLLAEGRQLGEVGQDSSITHQRVRDGSRSTTRRSIPDVDVRTAVARTSAYGMAVGQRHGEVYWMWATPVEAGHLALAGQDDLLEGAMGFQFVEDYQVGVSWLLTIAC